jgi:hypothetical protein
VARNGTHQLTRQLGDRTISKVKRRVLPLIVFLYFIAFLDRNNVGFAKLTMSEDIGLCHSVRPGRGHLLHRLRNIRDTEQCRHAQVRRPEVDRTDPGDLGFFATIMAFVQADDLHIIRFLLARPKPVSSPRSSST